MKIFDESLIFGIILVRSASEPDKLRISFIDIFIGAGSRSFRRSIVGILFLVSGKRFKSECDASCEAGSGNQASGDSQEEFLLAFHASHEIGI